MKALNEVPINLRAVGITLTLAALAIALLAVSMTVGSAQAQTPPYDPAPCGPGQLPVPDSPDATITEGHYGVFEGYWDKRGKTLNLNLCPPAVQHTIETIGLKKVEVSTRFASNIDIRRTVIHIDHIDGIDDDEQFEHTLTAADVEKYDFLKLGDGDNNGVDDAVGTTVWWLKVDDESTEDVDEDSPLAMGFSAALFESKYWFLDDGTRNRNPKGAEPLQYEFEVIREPGIPVAEQGHVFAFDDEDPPPGTDKTAYWDSSEVDANALPLYPGDYHHFQWIFTKPGTYEISVQLKGHVRQENPHEPHEEDYDPKWKPISADRVVTSEVERYTFQIGPLTLNEEPTFVVERSVEELSVVGTPAGDPIPVYQGDEDDLTFTLSGPGHSLFSVEEDSNGNAQIKVADSTHLDREVRSDYRLTLSVSDNKDREGNSDTAADSTISVRMNVTDLVERSVAENSAGGTPVGNAIVVANASATTTYTLSGNGHGLFSVERDSSNNAQVKVAPGAIINYEDAASYLLTLHADTDGTVDVRFMIHVEDDPSEQLAMTLTASPSGTTQTVGTRVDFTGTATGSPVATSQLEYSWWERDQESGNVTDVRITSPFRSVLPVLPGTYEFWMSVRYEGATAVESNRIVITFE